MTLSHSKMAQFDIFLICCSATCISIRIIRFLGEMPMTIEKLLWLPSSTQVAQAPIPAFMVQASVRARREFDNYAELQVCSIVERVAFWDIV